MTDELPTSFKIYFAVIVACYLVLAIQAFR